MHSARYPTRPGRPPLSRDEAGIVTAVALLLMVALTALGTSAIVITATDIKIGGNYRVSEQAFYAAEAGVEEARARLRGVKNSANFIGDSAATPDPNWSAYLLTSINWTPAADPNYSERSNHFFPTAASKTNTTITVNSLQNGISYWAKIRHKREFDAERAGHTTSTTHYIDGDGSTATHTAASPGNIIYYGYPPLTLSTTPVAFTTTLATKSGPVEIIRAYGTTGGNTQVVEIELARNPGPPVPAAVYARQNITGNGSSASVNGHDNCTPAAPSVPPFYTLAPATTNLHGSPTLNGSPPTPQSGSLDIPITDLVNNLRPGATVITADQNGTNFGSPTNYVTLFSDTANPFNVGGLDIRNGTGYGTLLVQGDLTLGGGFTWHGLILVTGTLTLNGGGGGINIRGAVLSNQTVDINGGLDIRYDSCTVENALNNRPYVVLGWRQFY